MKRTKTLTPEQAAARDARKAVFRAFVHKVGQMSAVQQAQFSADHPVITVDGHVLSLRNQILVALQLPQASVVGGFRQWISNGRAVCKGQHGAQILVPIGNGKHTDAATGEESAAGEVHFITGTVFDISQTSETETQHTVTEVDEAEWERRVALETAKCRCGKQAFGFMPACVLAKGHAGDCEDGSGGHYTNNTETETASALTAAIG